MKKRELAEKVVKKVGDTITVVVNEGMKFGWISRNLWCACANHAQEKDEIFSTI
jgi:hypothetical protein